DPDLGEHVFQQQPGAAVELADGEDLAVEIQALEGIVEHGRHDKRWRRSAAKSRRTAAVIGAAPYHSPFLRGRKLFGVTHARCGASLALPCSIELGAVFHEQADSYRHRRLRQPR